MRQGYSSEARGNEAADEAAQEAALKPVGPLQILVTLPNPDLPTLPAYMEIQSRKA